MLLMKTTFFSSGRFWSRCQAGNLTLGSLVWEVSWHRAIVPTARPFPVCLSPLRASHPQATSLHQCCGQEDKALGPRMHSPQAAPWVTQWLCPPLPCPHWGWCSREHEAQHGDLALIPSSGHPGWWRLITQLAEVSVIVSPATALRRMWKGPVGILPPPPFLRCQWSPDLRSKIPPSSSSMERFLGAMHFGFSPRKLGSSPSPEPL